MTRLHLDAAAMQNRASPQPRSTRTSSGVGLMRSRTVSMTSDGVGTNGPAGRHGSAGRCRRHRNPRASACRRRTPASTLASVNAFVTDEGSRVHSPGMGVLASNGSTGACGTSSSRCDAAWPSPRRDICDPQSFVPGGNFAERDEDGTCPGFLVSLAAYISAPTSGCWSDACFRSGCTSSNSNTVLCL